MSPEPQSSSSIANKRRPAKTAIKHSSIYAAGNISRQLVGFLMLPIYTRFLSPEDYGVIGLLTLSISVIEIVLGVRLLQAISKFYYEQDNLKDRNAVISGAFVLTGCASLIPALAFMLGSTHISEFLFKTPEFGLIVAIFSIQMISHAIENYALFYIRVQERPWLYISVSFAKLLVQLSLNIFFVVWLELGILGIAYSAGISAVVFSLSLGFYTLSRTGIRVKWPLLKAMLIFSWPLWLTGLAALYVSSSNIYFIGLFASIAHVGLYQLAAKFGSITSTLVWQPFSQYWQTERFKIYHEGADNHAYNDIFQIIATLLIIASTAVSLLAQPVIKLMASPEFHPAISAVPYLVFANLFASLTVFFNFSLLVKERTQWIAKLQYAMAGIVTILFLLLIPSMGFQGAALAMAMAELLRLTITCIISRRFYDMHLKVGRIALLVITAGGVSFFALQPMISELAMFENILIVTAATIIFSLFAVCYQLTNSRHRTFIFSLIKSKKKA